MDKPGPLPARRLNEVLRKTLNDAFAKQGFASLELVTRWREIVGDEIAACSQPEKIQWPRGPQDNGAPQPGTLLLRVEGPTALEIQLSSGVVLECVNRFLGWRAVAKLRLRQAPLARAPAPQRPPAPDPAATARLAAALPQIEDPKLRHALARLGASLAGERAPTEGGTLKRK
jgi:hypothetical protein